MGVSVADRYIVPQARLFHAQDVSNSLWAFATCRVQHQFAYEALAIRDVQIIQSFNQQGMANTVWSCAKMQALVPRLFEAAAAEACSRQLRDWSPRALVMLFWSFSEVRQCRLDLLPAVCTELQARAQAFNDVDLATLTALFRDGTVWPADIAHWRLLAL